MKYKFYFLIFVLGLISCKEQEARRPKQYRSTSYFYKELIDQNKRLNSIEKKYLEKIIKRDTSFVYNSTSHGFWYTDISHEILTKNNKPLSGDNVEINYAIHDLEGNVIYSGENVSLILDKQDFVPALHEGIKLMHVGQTKKFLIPSYCAYGVTGDGKKIKGNQSIFSTITLLKIKKKTNENN